VPGVGGCPAPTLPYRPSRLARLGADLVAELGYQEVDVAGVSWGGAIAQQLAHQYPKLCRRLVLAATSPSAIMVPARLSVLWKMATPRVLFAPAEGRDNANQSVIERQAHRRNRGELRLGRSALFFVARWNEID
jgi:pimeloyl-ACP methyl ester carboxylesterase